MLFLHSLARNGAGSFWAAPRNQYRLELWRGSGDLVKILVGDREWFEPWGTRASSDRSEDSPPATTVTGVYIDDERPNLLWVSFGVPAETWAEAIDREQRDLHGIPDLRPGVRYMDTVSEVVDMEEGRLIVTKRLPYAWRFAGADTVFRTWAD